jgi:hypothetical protein
MALIVLPARCRTNCSPATPQPSATACAPEKSTFFPHRQSRQSRVISGQDGRILGP